MAEKTKKETPNIQKDQQSDKTENRANNAPSSVKTSDIKEENNTLTEKSAPEKKETDQSDFTAEISENEKPEENVKTIEPTDLKDGDLILDIRSFLQHLKMSLSRPHWHIPAADIDPQKFIQDYHLDGSKTLNIICTTGKKSADMARKFIQAGFTNVTSVAGGMQHAKEKGLAMIEHPVWDMQKQTRFTGGLIVVIGCILGMTLSDIFYLIPFLMGIGLMFSAVTEHCLLEKILNEMPWNK